MARKKKHEEHTNHEAWAIPYGDLVTLLLALFVVMYAVSSVNEGKFRVLSDSLVAAFRGSPKTIAPIAVGQERAGKGGEQSVQAISAHSLMKLPDARKMPDGFRTPQSREAAQKAAAARSAGKLALIRMAQDVREALQSLIDKKLVVVHRDELWLEVEIRTDILFPSGVANISPAALPVLEQLAAILKPFPNPVRVEGHTDNIPMRSGAFPSNWELSAARAASVVHLFTKAGMDPMRLEIIGLGEYRPIADNKTQEGRNTNRRVRIVILQSSGVSETVYTTERRDENADDPNIAEPGANRVLTTVPPEDLNDVLPQEPSTETGSTPDLGSKTETPSAVPIPEPSQKPTATRP